MGIFRDDIPIRISQSFYTTKRYLLQNSNWSLARELFILIVFMLSLNYFTSSISPGIFILIFSVMIFLCFSYGNYVATGLLYPIFTRVSVGRNPAKSIFPG